MCNFYTKVQHIWKETCPQRKSLRYRRSLAPMFHTSRTCMKGNPPVTEKNFVVLLFRFKQVLLYVRNLQMRPRATGWIPMVNRKKITQLQCNVQ